ncbi:MAG TPA: glycosyltransferase family 39 protein [Candidatus Elarobacter sp.]|nr:glycosyltransferase family 39 protein [Candidatus Elarobacter sp.]
MKRRALLSAALGVLVLAVALITGVYRLRHDAQIWTSDSAIYLRMTLEDRGLSREAAKSQSDAFMAATPEGRNPEAAGFYTPSPPRYYAEQYGLFRSRPLYPRIAAALYGRVGPRGLELISVAAYVAASVLLYGILRLFVGPCAAAVGALAFATAPQVLAVAALPLTDELALLFWTAALGAMLRFGRSPDAPWLACVVVAALALTFTRPAAYLPVGAACGYLIAVRGDAERRRWAVALVVATLLVAAAFFVYSAAIHGPGLTEQLDWQYRWQRDVNGFGAGGSFARWYVLAAGAAVGLLLTVGFYKYAALLPLVLAGYGATIARRDDLGLLLGGAVATLVAVLANPLELNRTVLLPLTPVVVILATLAVGRLFGDRAATAETAR